jgi:hypothetical protein
MKWLLLFLLPISALANRSDSFRIGSAWGSSDYSALSLSGRYSLDDFWQLQGRFSKTKSANDQSTAASAGANVQADKDWNLGINLQGSREPNNIRSIGLAPNIEFILSSLWDSNRITTLHTDLEFNRYSQSSVPVGRSSQENFNQKAIHFLVDQELTEVFSANIFSSLYRYTASGSTINAAINRRRAASTANNSLVAGFPKNSFGLGLDCQASTLLSLGINASRSTVVDSSLQTHSAGADVKFSFESIPSLYFNYTRSRIQGEQALDLYGIGLGGSI